MSRSSSPAVSQLFQSAVDTGNLSQLAASAINIPDIGAQIQAGLGIVPDDVRSQDVVIVSQLIDDSGSIDAGHNAQLVRDGHNLMRSSLLKSKQASGILMHTRYLNGKVLYPYSLLDTVPEMDSHNYNPSGGTPLYYQTTVMLGTVLVKAQEFEDAGQNARSVTVIVTDGMDEGSPRKYTADSVKDVVLEMLSKERHIVGGIGIQYGRFNYRKIFKDMGLEDKWILTPGNNESEIRKAFDFMSQSAVRASQGGGVGFSKTAVAGVGGFATP